MDIVAPVVEKKENDGGYAQGMTLRDYFAGQALVGMLANPEVFGTNSERAAVCYGLADAMLAERKEGKS